MADNFNNPLVKIEKFSIKGITIDPTDIEQLDIFESINFPGVTGKLIFRDFGALKEVGDIFAGDPFKITFGREQDPPLQLNLTITESYGDTSQEDNTFNSIAFGFTSNWLINGFTMKRSRSFKDKKISEIVQILIEDAGGQPGIIIPTKQTLERFVTPYWSPIASIKYLMNFATDIDGLGGYLLWTDIEWDRVNFIPLGVLMNGNYGHVGFDLKQKPSHQRSAERIFDQIMEQGFDILKYADQGLGRSRFLGFNFDRTEVMTADKKIDEYGSNHEHLSRRLPLNDKFMGRQFRNTRNSWLFHNTDELVRNTIALSKKGIVRAADDLIEGRLHTRYSLLFGDMLKLNATTTGEGFQKRVGRLVKVSFPTSEEGKAVDNKQYSGTFLIRNIRHSIMGMEYANTITVIADGYKDIDRVDMIDWDGKNNFFDIAFNGDEFDIDTPTEIPESVTFGELIL